MRRDLGDHTIQTTTQHFHQPGQQLNFGWKHAAAGCDERNAVRQQAVPVASGLLDVRDLQQLRQIIVVSGHELRQQLLTQQLICIYKVHQNSEFEVRTIGH